MRLGEGREDLMTCGLPLDASKTADGGGLRGDGKLKEQVLAGEGPRSPAGKTRKESLKASERRGTASH